MSAATIEAVLKEPFAQIHWKVQMVTKDGKQCLAVPYLTPRDVMDRLDKACGVDGWADSYSKLEGGCIECSLSIKFGDAWITKADVGSLSAQPDAGDKHKAAYSDALKRAAVKFGVGRYLYDIPRQYVAYDSQRKCMTGQPKLPQKGQSAAPAQSPQKPAAQNPPPKGATPAPAGASLAPIVTQLKMAANLDDLAKRWATINTSGMTEAEKAELTIHKDRLKAVLAKTSTNR